MALNVKQRLNQSRKLANLSPQERLFVHQLVADRDFDPSRAALRAGYRRGSTGRRLLENPRILEAVQIALDDRLARTEMRADRILQEIAYCALRDPIDLYDENGRPIDDLRKIPEPLRRAIDNMTVSIYRGPNGQPVQKIHIRFAPKLEALALAAKHFGLLAPQEHRVVHSIDWDRLPIPDDAIEARLVTEDEEQRKSIETS